MEADFNDQRLRQAKNKQINVRNISKDLSIISIAESGAETKKLRTECYKIYERQSRQNLALKAKEREAKQSPRQGPIFKTK